MGRRYYTKFFDAYKVVLEQEKTLSQPMSDILKYICTIDLLDGVCYHPIFAKVIQRVEGNEYIDCSDSENTFYKASLSAPNPPRLDDGTIFDPPWRCEVCGFFHVAYEFPIPNIQTRWGSGGEEIRHKQLAAFLTVAGETNDDDECDQ